MTHGDVHIFAKFADAKIAVSAGRRLTAFCN